jgi:ABC-type xylose transport system substrate-binding protein
MPAGKQDGITLTFSKKNQNAKLKVENAEKRGWKKTEYICAAIMAFNEASEVKNASLDKESIEELIDKLVNEKFKNIVAGSINNENAGTSIKESIKDDVYSLEDNIEGINIGDD